MLYSLRFQITNNGLGIISQLVSIGHDTQNVGLPGQHLRDDYGCFAGLLEAVNRRPGLS